MESPETKMRLRLILGKFIVVKIEAGKAHVNLGYGVTMLIPILPDMDIRPGDLLTYYTEVPWNAPSQPTQKQ